LRAALLAVLAERGERPFALKPYESGGSGDSRVLQIAGGGWQPLESVCLYRLKAPLAPASLLASRGSGRRGLGSSGALEKLGIGLGGG